MPDRLVGRGSEERCRDARVGMVDNLILPVVAFNA
jgi:hypothetical protein